jgi:hypothetical protein
MVFLLVEIYFPYICLYARNEKKLKQNFVSDGGWEGQGWIRPRNYA